jgi:hypothetical protein
LTWTKAPPASPHEIAALLHESALPLPAEYIAFLRESNGGEGNLDVEPGWCQLWPAAEVIAHNASYDVQAELPGFLAFGSSGAGQLLAFDGRGQRPFPVVAVPYVALGPEEASPVAADFTSFVRLLGRPMSERRDR